MKVKKLEKGSPEWLILNLWWKQIEICGEFDNGAIAKDEEWDYLCQFFTAFCDAKEIPESHRQLARELSMAWMNWLQYKHQVAVGKNPHSERYDYVIAKKECK